MFAHRRSRGIGLRNGSSPAPCRSADVAHQFLQSLWNRFSAFLFGLWTLDFGLAQYSRVSSPHDFGNRSKIILAFDGCDFESPVIRTVGPAIFETDERCHRKRAADVGNIESFDALRRRGQF